MCPHSYSNFIELVLLKIWKSKFLLQYFFSDWKSYGNFLDLLIYDNFEYCPCVLFKFEKLLKVLTTNYVIGFPRTFWLGNLSLFQLAFIWPNPLTKLLIWLTDSQKRDLKAASFIWFFIATACWFARFFCWLYCWYSKTFMECLKLNV